MAKRTAKKTAKKTAYWMVNGSCPVRVTEDGDGGVLVEAWDSKTRTVRPMPRFASYVFAGLDCEGEPCERAQISESQFEAVIRRFEAAGRSK